MKRFISAIMLLILAAGPSLAGNITTFEDGRTGAVAELEAPAFSDTVNLTLPAECHILKATMNVSAVLPDKEHPDSPEAVRVFLNDTLLWEFNGTDFGAFGLQDRFADGMVERSFGFGMAGGTNETGVRLPKEAVIRNATVRMECGGPRTVQLAANFTGANVYNFFGLSVSGAGDVNGDGCDDVIVGAPYNWDGGTDAGRAYIYFGGPGADSTADVVLARAVAGDTFGWSVSGAGDVDKDGYDDVIVGAPRNSTGGHCTGRAYIFLGGPAMDGVQDVTITGPDRDLYLGASVSDAGDVNGDGYSDVIVGTWGGDEARSYIYFGGQTMDSTWDVNLTSHVYLDGFGASVSDAGDVDNDGYDDVIVGAFSDDKAGDNAGRAYIFHGGTAMDGDPDLTLTGAAKGDEFGRSVSGAGDLNGDGYGDVVVGAWKNDAGGVDAGRACIYLGGPNMDSAEDITLTGSAPYDCFGGSVAGAGDVDKDGYDDVIAGAENNDAGGGSAGRAYIYRGGAAMDGVADMNFTGAAKNDLFGISVSGAGDADNDGYDDIIVGAKNSGANGEFSGSAYLSKSFLGIKGAGVSFGAVSVVKKPSYFNGTEISPDFGPELTRHLRNCTSSGSDVHGNAYVDLPVRVFAASTGKVTLGELDISYSLRVPVGDFTDELNACIAARKAEGSKTDNLSIPVRIASGTPGRVGLEDLMVIVDGAPALIRPVPDAELPEDSAASDLVDLQECFEDDYDEKDRLAFSIASATNGSLVEVGLVDGRFVYADAFNGDQNDNWTGELEVVVEASDRWGSRGRSNPFRITVTNVNDPPVITEGPAALAEAGVPYSSTVAAVDAENDSLGFSLKKAPENMTIDAATGRIDWMPRARGDHPVTVAVSDGLESTERTFNILVPNKPPRVTSQPPLTALVGVPWYYCITFEDDNLDTVYVTNFLSGDISVIDVMVNSAVATMTPSSLGSLMASLGFSDGMAVVYQNFTVTVVQGNRLPAFTSSPVVSATVGVPYIYDANASDPDGDALTFASAMMPAGMTLDGASGKLSWTPSAPGNFTVKLNVSDGRCGFALQEFTIAVKDRVKARVEFVAPSEGQKVKGKLAVSGKATKGTLAVTGVQLRVDSGDWMDVSGNSTWTFSLDTAKLKNGKHNLQARAFDGLDHSNIANRTVTVDNQKAAAKGLIPGFAGTMALSAATVGLAILACRKRAGNFQ